MQPTIQNLKEKGKKQEEESTYKTIENRDEEIVVKYTNDTQHFSTPSTVGPTFGWSVKKRKETSFCRRPKNTTTVSLNG